MNSKVFVLRVPTHRRLPWAAPRLRMSQLWMPIDSDGFDQLQHTRRN